MRNFILIAIGLVVLSATLNAQQNTITGKVTGAEDGMEVIGATIVIKGRSTSGTISDYEGNYQISVSPEDTLIFSFVGFATLEIPVRERTSIDVSLSEDNILIEEVMVTALGMKREEKSLGYSIQKVNGEEVAKVKEIEVVNALSGKVSGVNIIQSDGQIGGGGSRIVIRGESSLAGNNDPLFIINNIPGNPNDIAPDDIESISVLKGPAAAALYGSKAGAGVVLITSKSGSGSNGLSVEINSNITFQTPLVLPDYQDEFGMGVSGEYSYIDGNGSGLFDDTRYSWGPRYDGELRPQFTGNDPWVAHPDNVKDFYQTGHVFINNFSISNSSDKSSVRFSYTNTDQKGILPNTGLGKNNIGLNAKTGIGDRITITSNINYIRTNGDNNKQVDVRLIPRSIDIAALQDYWVPGLEAYQQMNYRRSANNPYFIQYENPFSYVDSKVIANVNATIEVTDHLQVVGRFGTNYTNNEYYDRHAYSTYSSEPRDLKGYYKSGLSNTWDRNAEFLVSYNREFFSALTMNASFGGTHYRNEYKLLEGSAYELSYVDIFNLNNRDGHMYLSDYISKYERNSLYGFLNLDYKGKVFLDVTRRDDWSSTLHPDNNHFSYPSVSLSALMSNIFSLPESITFWKIRGSIAQVGNDIPVPYYTVEDKYSFQTSSSGLTYLDGSDIQTNPYLKPELTTGKEIGTDIRFYNNRLGLDLTYYNSITTNQILTTIKSITGGGTEYFTTNAGEIKSEGVELTINAVPVKTNDLTWDVQLNWSMDRSYLTEFNDTIGSKTQRVNAFLYIEDRPGQRRGTFYGKSYERAPNGERLYSLSGDTRLTDETQLGNYNPDWMASLHNSISYKDLSISFLLDLRYGGLIYNQTERLLNMYGLSEATLLNNREGIVPDGMVEKDGEYVKLTLQDLEDYGKIGGQTGQEYWANQMEEVVPENALINDTYLKLREVRIAYTLPRQLLQKTFIKSATVALVGRNLLVWSKVKHVDPETFGVASDRNDFGFSTKVPGYANSSMPSVRSYGFTLNCKF